MKRQIPFVLLISAFLLAIVSTATGEITYVDADAHGANDGTNWTDAFNYLQDALAAAQSGNEIWVAQSSYTPDSDTAHPGGTGNRQAIFKLKNGVLVRGGYAGYGETDPNARDIELYETILSGDLDGNDEPNFVNNEENSYHVVTGTGTNETALLDGFTITAGNANGSNTYKYNRGGGMYNPRNCRPTLNKCTFRLNWANHGGGMYNYDSRPTLNNCIFNENRASGWGGGIYNHEYDTGCSPILNNCIFNTNSTGIRGGGICNGGDSRPKLNNCTFSTNSAAYGGGVYNGEDAVVTLIECTFTSNSASGSGGGLYNEECSANLFNCTFTSNSASKSGGGLYNGADAAPTLIKCTFTSNSTGGNGGGIYNYDSSPTIKDCIISENSAIENGGGMNNNDSDPKVTNCIIMGNYAGWSGGAIFCQDSDPEIANCKITENFCEASGAGICGVGDFPVIKNCLIANNDGYFSGAAASVYGCYMTIINCTVADNNARHTYLATGGIYCWQGDAKIINTIVWNNNSSPNNQIEFFDGYEVCTVTYSDIQIEDSNLVWEGTGNLNDDPLFAAPESGDYHLKSTAGRWAQILDSTADLNDDDVVNWLDLGIFIDYWLYTGEEIYIELYREESIDFKDFAVLASNWLEAGLLDADFDESSFVDCIDLGIFTEYWLDTGREIPVDLYYEALINFKDYAVLALDWLHTGWVYSDTETSPCIDAGNPAYDYTVEPEPNGERINMGAYGNTKFASKSPY